MAMLRRWVSPGARWSPLWGLLFLVVLPFAIHWRLVLAGPVDQRHLCCDFSAHHYPAYLEGREWFRSGVFPHWNPYGNLGGIHFPSDPEVGLFYPPNWIVYAIGAIVDSNDLFLRAIYALLVSHIAFGALATALFARTWADLRWPYALLAGTVYAGSGFINANLPGHAHTVAFSLTPATLLVWNLFLKTNQSRWFAATAALLGLALLGGYHFVPLFVTIPTLLALALLRDRPLGRNAAKAFHHAALLGGTALLAVGLFCVQLIPIVLAYRESYRASVVSLEWSGQYRIDFSFFYQLIIPNLYTGTARVTTLSYWNYYLGLLPLVLLCVALLRPALRTRVVVRSGAIACTAFVIALGHQTLVHQLIYFFFPLIGIFRSISYFLVLTVTFGAIACGGLLQALEDNADQRSSILGPLRKLLVSWGIVAGMTALLIWTLHALMLAIGPQVYNVITALRASGAAMDSGISWETGKEILRVVSGIAWLWGMLAFLLTATIVALLLFLEQPSRKRLTLIALVFVVDGSAQLARHPSLTSSVNPARLYEANALTSRLTAVRGSELVRFVVDDGLPYRDYSANHQLFTQVAYSQIPPPYGRDLLSFMTSTTGLDAFNFRFLVTKDATPEVAPWRFMERVTLGASALTDDARIYENPGAMPRAFLVERLVTVEGNDPATQLAALRKADPRTHAVVFERDVGRDASPTATLRSTLSRGRVSIDHYGRGRVRMTVDTEAPGFVFMSDAYHPWWKLFVDGSEARLIRTDVHFRGFFVPAGRHAVEMRFDTTPFWFGAAASVASMLILVLVTTLHHCTAGI
jgi:hypothetical protein